MQHLIAVLPIRADSRLLSLLAGVAAVAALLVGPDQVDGAAAGVVGGYRRAMA